jgi:predicted RNase H-like HicB family nuclease
MLTRYLRAAMHAATYELLDGGEGFFGSVPGLDGVWANSPTLEQCREDLEDALEDWLLFRLSRQLSIPPVGGVDLMIREVA